MVIDLYSDEILIYGLLHFSVQMLHLGRLPVIKCTPQIVRYASKLYTSKPGESYAHNDNSHLGDAISKNLETVPLAYDKISPTSATSIVRSPLIMVHGLFGSKSNTRTVAKQLANELRRDVFSIDLRNFGSSPHHPRLDYPALAADVERFIANVITPEYESHKPICVGHSMGAKTVMALALRAPKVPAMIVSVDNAPIDWSNGVSGGSTFARYVRALRTALEKHRYTSIKDVDAELAKVEPNSYIRQFLLMNMKRGKKDEPIESKIPLQIIGDAIVKGKIALWPYDCHINRWNGPALFIRGTKSQYVPDDVIPTIGAYFPDFEVRDIDSGHWVISEKPEEFISSVTDFITRKEDEEEIY